MDPLFWPPAPKRLGDYAAEALEDRCRALDEGLPIDEDDGLLRIVAAQQLVEAGRRLLGWMWPEAPRITQGVASMSETLTTAMVKDAVRRHWDSRAATFDDVPNHGLHTDDQRSAWLARLKVWGSPDSLDTLDVGCGTGFLSLLLAQLGHRAVGVDFSAEMLDRARAKASELGVHASYRTADAESLPFADDSFDLVVERHVIWTLPEPNAALAEWSRVLRPNGHLVLIEGNWGADRPPSPGHADYQPIKDALPLYGGRPAEELVARARATGFVHMVTEVLSDTVLWGEPSARERYALHAWVRA